MSDLDWRQGLGGRRLQSPDQHDVLPAAQHLCADEGHYGGEPALFDRGARPDCSRHRPGNSAETGAIPWKYEQRAATTSLVATGGGLVFGGDAKGRFRTLDHETGEVLWEINLGSSVTGYPITYAIDARQYVAVRTGPGVNTTRFVRLTPELRPSTGNNIFVFALPNRD